MVAIARPQHITTALDGSSALAPVVPPLRLIQGGAGSAASGTAAADGLGSLVDAVRELWLRARPIVFSPAAVAALALLFAVVGVRAVQGTPPATGLERASVAEVMPLDVAIGESTLVVEAGATLWELAAEIAPDADRRETVAALAARNGGSSIAAGQVLVIPAGLAPAGS